MYPMPRLVFFLYYILDTMKFIFLSLKVFCFYTLNISDIIILSIPENSLRATKAQLHIFCLYVIFFFFKSFRRQIPVTLTHVNKVFM